MVSIIVPTLNEEFFLPELFKSLKNQTYKDFEVIISDAHSTDRTREIVKDFNYKVVDGGIPSIGRNNGVKAAKGDMLLFLDADVQVPDDFIEQSLLTFKRKDLDIACALFDKDVDSKIAKLAYHIWDIDKHIRQYTKFPSGTGSCIFVKRSVFDAIHGFKESVRVGEDVDFIQRAVKADYKFRILNTYYYASERRYTYFGPSKVILGSVIGGLSVGLGMIAAQKLAERMYGGWGKYNDKIKDKKD